MHEPRHPVEISLCNSIDKTIVDRARRIALMVFDVDGILTDGSLWIGPQGEQVKRFHVLDGHGLKMLCVSDIKVAIITARSGSIVPARAKELGIEHLLQGVSDKRSALIRLQESLGLPKESCGYMGDDLIDLPAMQEVGLAISVPNAPPYIAEAAHWVTSLPGGHGAARQCCDLILASQGKLSAFLLGRSMGSGVVQ
jgi:3-deoxy-D-manno-octulosonate 8-phosphate phosphatase (KDO 8-P phosphatase)